MSRPVRFTIFALLICWAITAAHAETLRPVSNDTSGISLPVKLTDQNLTFHYEYMAFNKINRGKTSNITGRAWREGTGAQGIRAIANVPLPSIGSLTEEPWNPLGQLLESVGKQILTLKVTKVGTECAMGKMLRGTSCPGAIEAQAQLGTFSGPVNLPIEIQRLTQSFRITGNGDFDPSQARSSPIGALVSNASVRMVLELPAQ